MLWLQKQVRKEQCANKGASLKLDLNQDASIGVAIVFCSTSNTKV